MSHAPSGAPVLRATFTTPDDGPAEHEGEAFYVLYHVEPDDAVDDCTYAIKLACGALLPARGVEVELGEPQSPPRPWQTLGRFEPWHDADRDPTAVWTACPAYQARRLHGPKVA